MTIKQLRKNKGWSQEDLARHSGLSVRTIQRAESGAPLGSESAKCLAAVFQTSVEAIQQESIASGDDQSNAKISSILNTKLSHSETNAVQFVHTLLNPDKSAPDPLTQVERNAINFAKRIIRKNNDK